MEHSSPVPRCSVQGLLPGTCLTSARLRLSTGSPPYPFPFLWCGWKDEFTRKPFSWTSDFQETGPQVSLAGTPLFLSPQTSQILSGSWLKFWDKGEERKLCGGAPVSWLGCIARYSGNKLGQRQVQRSLEGGNAGLCSGFAELNSH